MNKPVSVLLKLQGALIFGAIVGLGMFQDDPWLKGHIERMLYTSLTQAIGEPFSLTLTKLDLLGGKLVAEQLHVACSNGTWSFACPSIHINFSWLSWFKGKGFETKLTFQKPELYTTYKDKQWALKEPFFALIYAPATLPMRLTSCNMEQANFTVRSAYGTMTALGSSVTEMRPHSIITNIFWADGALHHTQGELAREISGLVTVAVPQRKPSSYSVKMQLSVDLPHVHDAEKRCKFFGTYTNANEQCFCRLHPEDHSMMIVADDITFHDETNCSLVVSGQLAAIAHYLPLYDRLRQSQGTGIFKADVSIGDSVRYKGTGTVTAFSYNDFFVDNALITFGGDSKKASGTVTLEKGTSAAEGKWNYLFDTARFGSQLRLSKQYEPLSAVVFEENGTHCSLKTEGDNIKAKYTLTATVQGKKALIKGMLDGNTTRTSLRGSFNGLPFTAQIKLAPFEILQFTLKDALSGGKNNMSLTQTQEGMYSEVDFKIIKELIRLYTGYTVQGQAVITSQSSFDGSRLNMQITAQEANIKIPSIYNVIKNFQGTMWYDSDQRCLTITDGVFELHKGRVALSTATFFFAEDGTLEYAHIPFIFHDLFISLNKNFFGSLFGGITATYHQGRWLCQGSIDCSKAQLHSNLLSFKVQQDLLRMSGVMVPVELALHVHTRSPVEVKTAFIQTQAHIDAMVKGTVEQPKIGGHIQLINGSLEFPYKPLYIMQGKLSLTPAQSDDPAIDLIAKNKIKKHTITLRVTGSLQQPKITFEASPHLSEENILILLLSGSDEGSLSMAMPSIAMMHVESLLFGTDEHLSKAQQFFKTLLKPLKNVRIVPSLNESDGKGLQGTIEVDINDRLRAKAQNNLKLSDETQVEVEYVLSDDMSVKAVRDDKGSLGGEVEMRWKF